MMGSAPAFSSWGGAYTPCESWAMVLNAAIRVGKVPVNLMVRAS